MAAFVALFLASLFLLGPQYTRAQHDPDRQGTDLSCGIIIWGDQDYKIDTMREDGEDTHSSNCIKGVQLARERCGGRSLNFVVTHFWKDGTEKDNQPLGFCYKTNPGDDQIPVVCTDISNTTQQAQARSIALLDEFYQGMKMCFTTAIQLGFVKIKITPHLDDGLGRGGWRNVLKLDPYRKRKGYSYHDIMLVPLYKALSDSIEEQQTTDTTHVYFSLQGEMNLALAAYPQRWMEEMEEARKFFAGLKPENVMIGVSLNFNKLCGSYCDNRESTTANVDEDTLKAIDMDAYQELLWRADFMGISSYPNLWPGYNKRPREWDFESSSRNLDDEMKESFSNLTLTRYIEAGKEFHCSEFGVGGGAANNGATAATKLEEVATYTFYGLFGLYGYFTDPWQRPEFREFRSELYKNVIRWLKNKGGPRYRFDGVFIWSMSSWDVGGLYWTSTTSKGTYYDEEVMKMIKAWNDERVEP